MVESKRREMIFFARHKRPSSHAHRAYHAQVGKYEVLSPCLHSSCVFGTWFNLVYIVLCIFVTLFDLVLHSFLEPWSRLCLHSLCWLHSLCVIWNLVSCFTFSVSSRAWSCLCLHRLCVIWNLVQSCFTFFSRAGSRLCLHFFVCFRNLFNLVLPCLCLSMFWNLFNLVVHSLCVFWNQWNLFSLVWNLFNLVLHLKPPSYPLSISLCVVLGTLFSPRAWYHTANALEG